MLLDARSIGNIGPLLEKEVRMPDASRDLPRAWPQPLERIQTDRHKCCPVVFLSH